MNIYDKEVNYRIAKLMAKGISREIAEKTALKEYHALVVVREEYYRRQAAIENASRPHVTMNIKKSGLYYVKKNRPRPRTVVCSGSDGIGKSVYK